MATQPQYDPWGMNNNMTAFDYAKPNMLPLIDPYWKQFPGRNFKKKTFKTQTKPF